MLHYQMEQAISQVSREPLKGAVHYGLDDPVKVSLKEECDLALEGEFENHPAPLRIYGDNDGSIKITKKRDMTKLAKHVRVKHHHIRELYELGSIEPVYVNTKDQIADVMTKGSGPVDHLKICRKFMYLPERSKDSPVNNIGVLSALPNTNTKRYMHSYSDTGGTELQEIMTDSNLIAASTLFQPPKKKQPGNATYISARQGLAPRQLDYIQVSTRYQSSVSNS